MANHKSALKRSRQSLKRYSVNRTLQSSIKNNITNNETKRFESSKE